MTKPLIAIVGSYDPERQQALGLRNLGLSRTVGEELGRELARQGYRIIVYSSLPYSLELDVVRGYVATGIAEPSSILVRFSPIEHTPEFEEGKHHHDLFDRLEDRSGQWQVPFYQSLSRADGILVVGGASTVSTAGIVVIGHGKPIVATAVLGGSAAKLQALIRTQDYPLEPADYALMGAQEWAADSAASHIALFAKQSKAFLNRARDLAAQSEKQLNEKRERDLDADSRLNLHAGCSALLFVLAVFSWPLASSIEATNTCQALCLALATPMLAGASGATMRVVVDWAIGVTRTHELSTYNRNILKRYLALGMVAGGLAGVSFVLAQIFASDYKATNLSEPLRKLVPFLVIIGFSAGLAAEVVLSNLRKSAPSIDVPSSKPEA